MNRRRVCALIGVVGFAMTWPLAAQAPPAPAESEPPLELEVEVGGKKYEALADKPFEIETGGVKSQVVIRPKPTRCFRLNGIEFRYPSAFKHQVEQTAPNLTTWTLEGDDCTLMIFRHADDTERGTLQSSLLEDASGKKVKTSKVSLTFRDGAVEGERGPFAMGGITYYRDVYAFTSEKDTVLLVIQDFPGADRNVSEEAGRVIRMLEESLHVTARH